MDDKHFQQILDRFGLSWKGYRKVRRGVKKRITKHMAELECRSVTEYLARLEDDPDLESASRLLLCVSISRFFRDRQLWRTIEDRLLPSVAVPGTSRVHVWSAGCARGEEPYSIAIVWMEFVRKTRTRALLELRATDAQGEWIDKAIRAVYSASSLEEVPPQLVERYFNPVLDSGQFAVSDLLRKPIVWETSDLLTHGPPASEFHIIFLRNSLLTYYEDPLRIPVLKRITESLRPGGFLVIGSHEHLPEGFPTLAPSPFGRMIFTRTC
jgi:chemotaxis protein methyltransferase CheR